MSKLEKSAKDRNDKERKLEQAITKLVKTMYRLMSKPSQRVDNGLWGYEPTTPELDKIVKGYG